MPAREVLVRSIKLIKKMHNQKVVTLKEILKNNQFKISKAIKMDS
jgi:hypothetical protein